ncbi:hypothetical protein MAM1_0045d03131 [Mucor ambiguus]|uniref:Uncharacterized protein n=1 Tax=Mucor ambiguus TaxID=91626 RepID=A0A0C9M3Q8_9FUNG|nr:hypothetical protein MAM1_0045d03131 [Mucor ambiguus]
MRTRSCIYCGIIKPSKKLLEQHQTKCSVKSSTKHIMKLRRCNNMLPLKAILCNAEKPKIIKAQQHKEAHSKDSHTNKILRFPKDQIALRDNGCITLCTGRSRLSVN